jgi:hypothetical protein
MIMKSRSGCDRVRKDLPEEIGDRINVEDNTATSVAEFIAHCLEYPDGMESLIQALQSEEEEKNRIFVQRFAESWELVKRTCEIAEIILHHVGNEALFLDRVTVQLKWRGNKKTWIGFLAGLWDTPGFRYSDFLKDLEVFLSKRGISMVATDLFIAKIVEIINKNSASFSEQLSPYLTVVVIPQITGGNYRVEFYVWKKRDGEEEGERIKGISDENLSSWKEALPDRIIEALGTHFQKNGKVVIEIFLPMLLIMEAIDQWKTTENIREKLGVSHQVVFRVFERVEKLHTESNARAQLGYWKEKWELTQNIICLSKENTYWLKASEDHERTLAQLRGENFICVGGPCFIKPKTLKPKLDAMMQAGIPLGFLSRPSVKKIALSEDDLKNEIERMVCKEEIEKIPRVFQEQRRQAVVNGDDNHWVNHITLIFDNPNRIPPPYDPEN